MLALYITGAILLLVALLAFIVTTAFEHKAEVIIHKPKAEVFDYLKSLKNQDSWNIYSKSDPDMKREFTGTDSTVGFIEAWDGNKKVGKGAQEIKKITEGERIEIEFRFERPFRLTNDIYYATTAVDEHKTKVVWCMSGRSPRPFNLLFPLVKGSMLKGLNKGLANLKTVLENKGAAQGPA